LWLTWLVAMIYLFTTGLFNKGAPSEFWGALTEFIPNFYVLFLLIWVLPGSVLWQVLKLGDGIGFGLSVAIGVLASLMGFVIGVPVFFAFFYVLGSMTYALGH
jgi:hypothetical protein